MNLTQIQILANDYSNDELELNKGQYKLNESKVSETHNTNNMSF